MLLVSIHYSCKKKKYRTRYFKLFILFTIIWKNVIVGFFVDYNETTKLYNIFLSFIAFRIYKYKMFCRVENLEETSQSLRMYIKEITLSYCSVLSFLHQMKEKKLFQNFAFMLWICIYAYVFYVCMYVYIYIRPPSEGDSPSVV